MKTKPRVGYYTGDTLPVVNASIWKWGLDPCRHARVINFD
jgi:hypothetical protein